jgi:hypothetical protein
MTCWNCSTAAVGTTGWANADAQVKASSSIGATGCSCFFLLAGIMKKFFKSVFSLEMEADPQQKSIRV